MDKLEVRRSEEVEPGDEEKSNSLVKHFVDIYSRILNICD